MKKFHIGDILSVTTGKLVSPRHIDGVYDILGYMSGAGGSVWTHELPVLSDKYKPYILEKYPELKGVNTDNVNVDNWEEWLNEKVAEFGEKLEIPKIGEGRKEMDDPITSLEKMMK